jgi:hypothetical protein
MNFSVFSIQVGCLVMAFPFTLGISVADGQQSDTWASSVSLPESETPTHLFDGQSLDGWEGLIEQYWSIDSRGNCRSKPAAQPSEHVPVHEKTVP